VTRESKVRCVHQNEQGYTEKRAKKGLTVLRNSVVSYESVDDSQC
jgi:hypothetical protein